MTEPQNVETPAADPAAVETPTETVEFATFDDLLAKPATRDDFVMDIGGQRRRFMFEAIGSLEVEQLMTKAGAPTLEQQAQGYTFNTEKYQPMLLAKVCQNPRLTETQWGQLMRSPKWSRGDWASLFFRADELCRRTPDSSPFVDDSEQTGTSASS